MSQLPGFRKVTEDSSVIELTAFRVDPEEGIMILEDSSSTKYNMQYNMILSVGVSKIWRRDTIFYLKGTTEKMYLKGVFFQNISESETITLPCTVMSVGVMEDSSGIVNGTIDISGCLNFTKESLGPLNGTGSIILNHDQAENLFADRITDGKLDGNLTVILATEEQS